MAIDATEEPVGTHDKIDWNMAKFFIIAIFQIGKRIKGLWEVTAIPENKPAIKFDVIL